MTWQVERHSCEARGKSPSRAAHGDADGRSQRVSLRVWVHVSVGLTMQNAKMIITVAGDPLQASVARSRRN